eukprot:245591-Amphidinium_carterae.1
MDTPHSDHYKGRSDDLLHCGGVARGHLQSLLGVVFITAQASLLLNTLANLSFYLLLRAEGAPVRAHPVVAQLVPAASNISNGSPPLQHLTSRAIHLNRRCPGKVDKDTGTTPAKAGTSNSSFQEVRNRYRNTFHLVVNWSFSFVYGKQGLD